MLIMEKGACQFGGARDCLASHQVMRASVWVANGFTCRANIERSIGSLVELTLNDQFSEIEPEIERTIFSLTNWSLAMNIYNKYIHRQFSHDQNILFY